MAHESAEFHLPLQVASPVDIGRLIRELTAINDLLTQAALRKETDVKLPKTTGLMDQLLQLNKIDLNNAKHREAVLQFLALLKAKAPLLHMSFSAEPSTDFVDKLLSWLRKEIHPNVLLTIGLQPNIGAGCIVRSTNKYFDFSLRQDFAKKRDMLLEKLGPALNTAPGSEPAPAAAGPMTVAVEATEAARAAAPTAQAVHAAPQPTAKLMAPAKPAEPVKAAA